MFVPSPLGCPTINPRFATLAIYAFAPSQGTSFSSENLTPAKEGTLTAIHKTAAKAKDTFLFI